MNGNGNGNGDEMAGNADSPMSVYERGMAVRRAVLGDAHVDRASAATSSLDARFQQWITESAWGTVWADDTLDRRSRTLTTIAILAALGREELALHVRAALANGANGASPAEIGEVLMHVGVYAGVPAANAAFAVVKEVLSETAG
jgi:4-carboxymuconolactone decarboxylase